MKNLARHACYCLLATWLLAGCDHKKLPILGEPSLVTMAVKGKQVKQLIYPAIPDFTFKSQDNELITQRHFDGKIYVANFFLANGPAIGNQIHKNMLKVYDRFKSHQNIRIISHSVDPENDTPIVLKRHAKSLGVTGNFWYFVTGESQKIREIGKKYYVVGHDDMGNDASEPVHICSFLLIDKEKHIRGMYDATSVLSTKELIKDIEKLLDEYQSSSTPSKKI